MFDIVLMNQYNDLFMLGLLLLSGVIHLFCLLSKLTVQLLTGRVAWIGIGGILGLLMYSLLALVISVVFIGAYSALAYLIKELTWQGYPDVIYYVISVMGLLISGSYGLIVVRW